MNKTMQDIAVISFIIPALNEENRIGETLQAIKSNPPSYPYQIIVVDNGSTDRTSEIVQAQQAILIMHPKGSIASARNKGVWASQGQILVFLDADVIITASWQKEIGKVVANLKRNYLIITGSRCGVVDEGNWFSRYWFSRLQNIVSNYINSGHMITTRKLFNEIGGFNSEFHTAEDYDFSLRAKHIGAKIVNNPKLFVIHADYPTTLKDFIIRERWHGYEDFKNFRNILKSKVALIAIINVVMMFVFFAIAILYGDVRYVLPYFFFMYLLSIISTIIKFRFGDLVLLLNTSTIFYFYYVGRSLSLIDRIKNIYSSKYRSNRE